jgi:ribosome assembly protein YihI (activator of Der GTPase)
VPGQRTNFGPSRKKAALKKLSKRNQTDELYEELSRAADTMIEMQQAVDEGLDCLERIAGEMEE